MKIKTEIEKILQKNYPFVLFRRPNENKTILWKSKTNDLLQTSNFLEDSFVFAPFASDKKVFFLREGCEIFHEVIKGVSERNIQKKTDFQDKETHILLVEKGIQAIKRGEFSKVVLARREELSVENTEYFAYFRRMLYQYPTAYVYWWYHPEVGMWMGATPELLLKKKSTTLQTVSLAGTVSAVDKSKEEVVWGEKEKIEQQVVTDFIASILKKHSSKVEQSAVYTCRAGNLFHLKTDIQAEITDDSQLKTILSHLHPTPALCGFPKEEARKFILENEGFTREFYGGFLGEYQLQNEKKEKKTQLFVNLRCMQLVGNKLYLYIGGGVNKDSIAEKEYEETVNKSKTIKQIL